MALSVTQASQSKGRSGGLELMLQPVDIETSSVRDEEEEKGEGAAESFSPGSSEETFSRDSNASTIFKGVPSSANERERLRNLQ